MDEGITSPPYPGNATASSSLYRHLAALRLWLVEQQAILRLHVPQKYADQLVEPDNMAAETVWDHVGVVDKYTTLMYCRRIRESWDHVVREHEDTWDSKLSLKKRFSVVLMCQHILHEAFVDPELREARQQTTIDRAQHEMKLINDHLKKVLIPPELQESDAEEKAEEDDDDWFIPEGHEQP